MNVRFVHTADQPTGLEVTATLGWRLFFDIEAGRRVDRGERLSDLAGVIDDSGFHVMTRKELAASLERDGLPRLARVALHEPHRPGRLLVFGAIEWDDKWFAVDVQERAPEPMPCTGLTLITAAIAATERNAP